MTFFPYLVAVGFVTFAVGFVWAACVWLPELVRRERILQPEDPESIDACATTGRFTRFDVDED